jgi:hypothetical protein
MDSSLGAPLSPQELASIRCVSSDPRRRIPRDHRRLLVTMRLIRLAAGALIVTAEGRQRVPEEYLSPRVWQQPSQPSNDA